MSVENVDQNIYRLVNAINDIEGVNTHSSCGGHKNKDKSQVSEDMFNINFEVDYNKCGWKALEYIVMAIYRWNQNYSSQIALTPWIDGGLCFDMTGIHFTDELIELFAGLVEHIDCPAFAVN
ncbi:hypothetical protein LCGC14_0932860 [marine sediment metagenome]|uniref:Uncharacterized protein n=1 Tax=marine sediment metagenome TaxID=412755 RepID=A0A0F9NS30_9ZZZZ